MTAEPKPDALPVLRSDAERNRSRILEAARDVFAADGWDAPMERVARAAGVGVATLYRRFPSRADLLAAAFEEQVLAYAAAAEDALRHSDPWQGFVYLVQRLADMQLANRGFAEVLTMSFPNAKEFEAARSRAYRGFVELINLAQEAGELRADFVPEDLMIVLMANAGIVTVAGDTANSASPRLIAYLIEAFANPGRSALPNPPTPTEIYGAFLRHRWRSPDNVRG